MIVVRTKNTVICSVPYLFVFLAQLELNKTKSSNRYTTLYSCSDSSASLGRQKSLLLF